MVVVNTHSYKVIIAAQTLTCLSNTKTRNKIDANNNYKVGVADY